MKAIILTTALLGSIATVDAFDKEIFMKKGVAHIVENSKAQLEQTHADVMDVIINFPVHADRKFQQLKQWWAEFPIMVSQTHKYHKPWVVTD